jgi:hypothetical protein
MAIPVHRMTDLRVCGATTVVTGQGNVYANGLLVSVSGDPNSHGNGNTVATANNVFINGLLVTKVGDTALPDDLCTPRARIHCAPNVTTGSGNVFTS